MTSPLISLLPFDKAALKSIFGEGNHLEYLHEYLSYLSASKIVVEEHYIDRHYLEDFEFYYARSFFSPGPACKRVHFFKYRDKFEDEVKRATLTGNADTIQPLYLGFAIQRPLDGARLGRTVLQTYPEETMRHYTVVRDYEVNLAGLKLHVKGLAFQSQDGGAAVCASTALWSALQRVAQISGHRTPSPSAITTAAKSPYPASNGLDQDKMAEAITALGYTVDYFDPEGNRSFFRAKVMACLRSGLPVILLLEQKTQWVDSEVRNGHAITIVGYRDPCTTKEVSVIPDNSIPPIKMHSVQTDVFYAHDDNLGPYAHFEVSDSEQEGRPVLSVLRGRSNGSPAWWIPDRWTVSGALVPKPDKHRVPIDDLFWNVYWINPMFQKILQGIEIAYDLRFFAGIEMSRTFRRICTDSDRLFEFHQNVSLPRYVAAISLWHGEKLLLTLGLDATQVSRSSPSILLMLAEGIPSNSLPGMSLFEFCRHKGIPILFTT